MHLIEFNQASETEVKTFLKHCVQIESWSNTLSSQRPYESLDALLATAKLQAQSWDWQEIKTALDKHPRIGEKKAQSALSDKEQSFSDREQSEISSNEEMQQAILQGNIAYEKKYGYIFLIKASGLSSEDILQALTYRLLNDPENEKRIVHHQLAEIALLRLQQELKA